MGAFGDNLRRERELRGVSLVEISSATKIGARLLDAIETERFDRLPGGVFNAAFVRQYARYLGLNEDRVVAEFLAACTASGPQETQQKDPALMALRQMATAESQRPKRHQPLPLIIAAGLLIVGALIVGGWRIWHGAPSEPPKQVSLPKAVAPIAPPVQQTADPNAAAAASTNPAAANPASPNPTPTVAAPAIDSVPKTEPPQDAPANLLTLDLAAKDRCTIVVSIDGRPEWRAVMAQGTHRNVKAGRAVQLTVDDAAALVVTRNGELLPPLGASGESKTVTYRLGPSRSASKQNTSTAAPDRKQQE